MRDATNSREEGAFSAERAGAVPIMQLVDLCFSGKYTRKQVEQLLFRAAATHWPRFLKFLHASVADMPVSD